MTRLVARKAVFLAAAVLATGTATMGCSKKDSGRSDNVGSIGMAIVLSPGVVINSVTYSITGNGITPITGSVNVAGAGSTVSLLVQGIPAGNGYTLALNGTSVDGLTTCMGTQTFNVVANQTTGVSVTLQCRGPNVTGGIMVDGRFDNCPMVNVTASPLTTGVGGVISLSAVGSDLDGDALTYAWTGAPVVGTFNPANAASSSFTCTAVGPSTLTVTVSDGRCTSTNVVAVTCVSAGGGTGGAGTGGRGTGGANTGGANTGGANTGGANTGGANTGGAATGGAGGGVCSEIGSAACNACTANFCDPSSDGCCSLPNAADIALCQAAAACFRDRACTLGGDPTNCFCGTSGPACSSAPTGVCLPEIQAAAKSTVPGEILSRFVSADFPIGHAVNLYTCRLGVCPSECPAP
ncbi:MAG: hypothetical protein ABUS79_05640 [Pseudomonadota bacterium]